MDIWQNPELRGYPFMKPIWRGEGESKTKGQVPDGCWMRAEKFHVYTQIYIYIYITYAYIIYVI